MGTRRDVAHSTASGRKSVGTTTSTTWALLGCAGLSLLAALALAPVEGAQRQPWPNADADPTVTPVVGPSWLTHLGAAVDSFTPRPRRRCLRPWRRHQDRSAAAIPGCAAHVHDDRRRPVPVELPGLPSRAGDGIATGNQLTARACPRCVARVGAKAASRRAPRVRRQEGPRRGGQRSGGDFRPHFTRAAA